MAEDALFLGFTGHINMDIVLRTDHIPTSGSTSVTDIEENFGGTAGNFAMVAARLGYPFRVYSSVSLSTHREYLDFLHKIGVDTSGVYLTDSDRGPVCYTVSDSGEQIYFVYQGPMASPYLHKVIGNIHHEYLHLGTGLPEDLRWAAENVPHKNLVFDPGQEIAYRYNKSDLEYFMSKAKLCILNENENRIASRILGKSPENICSSLIVTMGVRGSVLYEGGQTHSVPPRKSVRVYDTIGAGDAFRAGLYLGLYKRFSLLESMRVGSVVASLAIQGPLRDFSYSQEQVLSMLRD